MRLGPKVWPSIALGFEHRTFGRKNEAMVW